MKGVFFIVIICLISCSEQPGQKYSRLVKSELSSGKRNDSLFLGMYLGMPSKQFYLHCWQLNKQGLITDGVNNSAVLYKLHDNELKYPASMNFYPAFNENGIYRMKSTFEYDGWAPWNKHLNSNHLLPDVISLLSKWFPGGNSFIELANKEKGHKIYVKVDGNRRILVGINDDRIVNVEYSDLKVEAQ